MREKSGIRQRGSANNARAATRKAKAPQGQVLTEGNTLLRLRELGVIK